MPFDRKAYMKKYRKENKDKYRQYNKKSWEKNKNKFMENRMDYQKQYEIENPHIFKISDWKHKGIKLRPNEDWDSVYLYWKTCERCELCDVELTDGPGKLTSRNLDHDHSTGYIRNVLCWGCNIKRG